jgi:small subunit ribosomal protein S2
VPGADRAPPAAERTARTMTTFPAAWLGLAILICLQGIPYVGVTTRAHSVQRGEHSTGPSEEGGVRAGHQDRRSVDRQHNLNQARSTTMAVVTIRQLLDSGVHFGHQTRRWNPKVKRFILTERSGIHIIDLQQSLGYIDKAYDFVKETVAHGGTILFVGTKKQAQEILAEQATRVGQPYVNQRWLGGLLTNFSTIAKRLARMKELEELDYENPAASGFTKKELLLKKRELDKLHKSLGGIRNLAKTPSALWVVDAKREHLAIDEAKKLGIPVIGILDTNADPDDFQYPIPGNDDAIRSVSLLTRIIADAAAEGLQQKHNPEAGDAEPLAEWEQELLEGAEAQTAATESAADEAGAAAHDEAIAAAAGETVAEVAGAESADK